MRNPISVVAAALCEDLRDAARLARREGFAGMQLPVRSAALNIPELSASGRREVRRILAAENQGLVGLCMQLEGGGLAPGADVDRALDSVEQAMESAAGLGARLLCVDIGALPAPAPSPAPAPPARPGIAPARYGRIIIPEFVLPPAPAAAPAAPSDPAFVAQVDAALVEMGCRADRYSVTVALRSDLASLAAVERALKAADCPWFGVDLDPVAILRDEWSVDEVFSRLGPLIRHVRARDAVRGAERRTRPAALGAGDVDWDRLLAYLDEAGYRGWVTVDPLDLPDRAAAAVSALARLRAGRRGSPAGGAQ